MPPETPHRAQAVSPFHLETRDDTPRVTQLEVDGTTCLVFGKLMVI